MYLNIAISPVAEFPEESADVSGSYNENFFFHLAARSYYESVAIEETTKWMERSFDPSNSRTGSYETPPELFVLNTLPANQIHVACADEKYVGYRCRLIARYEEYFIMFYSDISQNGVTPTIFRDLVLKINDKMLACLDSTPEPVTK
jgi:hypothetical protein